MLSLPLPSKSECENYKDCHSKVVKIEIDSGTKPDQAVAIATSHCGKLFGKTVKKAHELLVEMKELLEEAKKPKKWMQKAAKKMKQKGTEGSTTAECKKMGYDGVTDECLRKLLKRGGVWTKRANFALNARKMKK